MRFKNLNQDEFRVNVQSGYPDTKLARLYGVSDKTISRWREALGLRSHWAPERMGCGTASEYARGCRCDRCKEANRIKHARAIVKMRTKGLSPGDPRHGTYSAYTQWGCRCEPCATVGMEKHRDWWQKNRGTGRRAPRWTHDEEQVLRTHSPAEAARLVGRSITATYQHRARLGLTSRRTKE